MKHSRLYRGPPRGPPVLEFYTYIVRAPPYGGCRMFYRNHCKTVILLYGSYCCAELLPSLVMYTSQTRKAFCLV